MTRKALILILMVLLVVPCVLADTITLKSGQQVEGNVTEKTDNAVKISAYGTEMTYFIDEIDTVNGQKVTVTVKEQAAPAVATSQVAAPAEATVVQVTAPEVSVTAQEASPRTPPMEIKVRGTTPTTAFQSLKVDDKAKVAAFAGLALIILVVALIFSVYVAICLFFIAKKTGKEPAWLAWIPIGNIFLMCKIASLSYWWILGFLAGFIPFIGGLFTLALSGFFWYRIALARNKPGWIGILALIPIANLVIMGYLAFTE